MEKAIVVATLLYASTNVFGVFSSSIVEYQNKKADLKLTELGRKLAKKASKLLKRDNKDLKKVFFDAISKGQSDSVENLAASFSLNSVVYNGDTPATVATRSGNIQTMQVLLEEGASFSKKNKKGETPLGIAIRIKDFEKVRFLIENQVTISSTVLFDAISYADNEQRVAEALDRREHMATKPDYYLAMTERCEIIKHLIEHGANVNAKNEIGDTLMCHVARCGNFALDRFTKENGEWVNLVEYLMPKVGNYLESNKEGQTPLDISRSLKNTRMTDFLESVQARAKLWMGN